MTSPPMSKPVTLTYWDPANLLQITSDVDNNNNVKINCVGRAKHDVRCRWDILDPELSKVRPLLRQMSETKPEAVTEETLRLLASLCLCRDWHSGQLYQTVRCWREVVKTATLHNKNLVASAGSSPSDLEERLNNSKKTAEKLSAQVAFITKKYQDCQDTNRSQQQSMTSLEESGQALHARVKEESTARVEAEQRNVSLKDRIAEMEELLAEYQVKISFLEDETRRDNSEDQIRALQMENEELESGKKMRKADIDRLRANLTASRDGEQHLRAELSAATQSLKQCRMDLTREQSRNAALIQRTASLEMSQAELMEGSSGCGLRKIWGRVSRKRGSSKGSDSGMVSQETIVQTSKV